MEANFVSIPRISHELALILTKSRKALGFNTVRRCAPQLYSPSFVNDLKHFSCNGLLLNVHKKAP